MEAVPPPVLIVYFPTSFSVSASLQFITCKSSGVFLHSFHSCVLCCFVCVNVLNFVLWFEASWLLFPY